MSTDDDLFAHPYEAELEEIRVRDAQERRAFWELLALLQPRGAFPRPGVRAEPKHGAARCSVARGPSGVLAVSLHAVRSLRWFVIVLPDWGAPYVPLEFVAEDDTFISLPGTTHAFEVAERAGGRVHVFVGPADQDFLDGGVLFWDFHERIRQRCSLVEVSSWPFAADATGLSPSRSRLFTVVHSLRLLARAPEEVVMPLAAGRSAMDFRAQFELSLGKDGAVTLDCDPARPFDAIVLIAGAEGEPVPATGCIDPDGAMVPVAFRRTGRRHVELGRFAPSMRAYVFVAAPNAFWSPAPPSAFLDRIEAHPADVALLEFDFDA